MLRQAEERLLEIPHFRDVYEEVVRARENARKNHEYNLEEWGPFRVPSTECLCDWLDEINKVIDQRQEDARVPKNFEEEKLCVLSTIVYNMIKSILYWNIGFEYVSNDDAAEIVFTPCEALMKELEEKGYWTEETNQPIQWMHNDVWLEGKCRYIHNIPVNWAETIF